MLVTYFSKTGHTAAMAESIAKAAGEVDRVEADLREVADVSADDLLVQACSLLAAGVMRRYAAVLNHRATGAKANVMVAWKVDENLVDQAAQRCITKPQVSHCYLRRAAKSWPYTLYTMIHGRNPAECEKTIREIANETGLGEYAALWTVEEYKKQPVRYFSDDEVQWERIHAV
jgi:DNA-binding Lrp family transcriptional regulator